MTTFLFTAANGTTLSSLDAKWSGDAANFVVKDNTLTLDARNVIYKTWYANGQGNVQSVSLSYVSLNTPNVGAISYPTLQTNATQAGYLFQVASNGLVVVFRNGSLIAYFTNLQGVFDPNTNPYTLTASLLAGGVLVGYINGVEAGRQTDSTPLTGGFPGITSDYAYDVTTYVGANLAWSDSTTISFPAPNAPTNVVASTTAPNPYQASITWSDNSTNETGFTVQIETPSGAGNWTNATVTGGNPTAANINTATVTGLSAATSYRFRLAANGQGPSSAYVVSNAITTGTAITPPTAPSNAVAGTVTEQSFSLTWNDNSSNEDSFKVEIEHPSGAGNWALASGATNPTAPNTTSFQVTGLAGGTQYRARVTATNLGGSNSVLSNAITTTVITIPTAPTNIFVTQIDNSGAFVSWSDNSTNETGFTVQIETPSGAGNWTNATGATNPAPASSTSFTLANLTANTSYRVRVASTNSAGSSTPLVSSTFNTLVTPTPYAFVFNQADGTTLAEIDSRFQGDVTDLSVVGSGLGPNLRNIISSARLVSKQGLVQKSSILINRSATSAIMKPCVMMTGTREGYRLEISNSDQPVLFKNGSLTWIGSAATIPTGNYTLSLELDTTTGILTTKVNGTSIDTFTDTNVLTGGYPGFISDYTSDVSLARTMISWTDGITGALTSPAAPANLTVSTIASTSVVLNWLIGDINTTSFIVQYSLAGSGNWFNANGDLNPTAPNTTSFVITQLLSQTSYQFRIAAVNGAGQSAWVTSSAYTTAQLGLVTPFIFMYPF